MNEVADEIKKLLTIPPLPEGYCFSVAPLYDGDLIAPVGLQVLLHRVRSAASGRGNVYVTEDMLQFNTMPSDTQAEVASFIRFRMQGLLERLEARQMCAQFVGRYSS